GCRTSFRRGCALGRARSPAAHARDRYALRERIQRSRDRGARGTRAADRAYARPRAIEATGRAARLFRAGAKAGSAVGRGDRALWTGAALPAVHPLPPLQSAAQARGAKRSGRARAGRDPSALYALRPLPGLPKNVLGRIALDAHARHAEADARTP